MEDGICTIMKPSDATFEPLVAHERNGVSSVRACLGETRKAAA